MKSVKRRKWRRKRTFWIRTLLKWRRLNFGLNLPTLEAFAAVALAIGGGFVPIFPLVVVVRVCAGILGIDGLSKLTIIPWEEVNINAAKKSIEAAGKLLKYALAAEETIHMLSACDGTKKALKAVIERSRIKPPASVMDETGDYFDGFHHKEDFIDWYTKTKWSAIQQLMGAMEENAAWYRRQLRVLGSLYTQRPKPVKEKPAATKRSPRRKKPSVMKEPITLQIQRAVSPHINKGSGNRPKVDIIPEGKPVVGPSMTRYDFRLPETLKLSELVNLSEQIAFELGVESVMIAPVPNFPGIVGVEVPNEKPTPVSFREVVASREFRVHPSPVAFALGKDITGKVIIGDLAQLPHILIAGTTGSGKSVCMNALICSMLSKSGPDKVKFIMTDPKMVELSIYNGIPHLTRPVVTDLKEAVDALQSAVTEITERDRLFMERGVKNLDEYNKAARKHRWDTLPRIVVVIDELADLMIVAGKEVETPIQRIAQIGRAAGIHLVVATQRPDRKVVTGLIKSNIQSRIAFAVATNQESRIILDHGGAENLIGKGDMFYAPANGKTTRVQGCLIETEEIRTIIEEARKKV